MEQQNHSQMRRRVSLLGCTGSVGTNALDVIRQHRTQFEVVSLSCGSSLDLLWNQIQEFQPKFVSVGSEDLARVLRTRLPKSGGPQVFWGPQGHESVVAESQPDIVMSAMLGTFGLQASLKAATMGVPVLGIANKEILVMAGHFIQEALKASPTVLVPVDSEHSAIFQALMGNDKKAVRNLWLTGSGGPFRTRDLDSFSSITRAEALKHPNWSMGAKITIDSATMMNKGLEFIEALRLFSVPADKVKIIIHPESIVHSMVEYCDGSFMAQLGVSDMRMPISLALGYPHRLSVNLGRELDLAKISRLHFEEPDYEKFPCLRLALTADQRGPTGPVVLNAANEVAVERFLRDDLSFLGIADLVENALESFSGQSIRTLDDVIELDQEVKAWAQTMGKATERVRSLSSTAEASL